MHNPGHDKELDDFSREAAAQYHAPGSPDWGKLSRELDRLLPVEKRKRRFGLWWWLLPVLLTGAAGGYWMVSQRGGTDTATEATTNTQPATPGANTTTDHQSMPAGTQVQADQTTAPAAEIQQNKKRSETNRGQFTAFLPSVKRNNTPNGSGATASVHTIHTGIPVPDGKTVRAAQPAAGSPNAMAEETNAVKDDRSSAGNTSVGMMTTDSYGPSRQQETAQQKNTAPAQEKTTRDSLTAVSEPVPAAKKAAKTKLPPLGRGFSAGIIAGMDLSTVKFRYGNEPGYNIGLIGGYHFNRAWSVHTGLIYTQKNYKLAGSDFTAPKGSWASYYKILTIEGYCRMYEWPLLVRYGFNAGERNRYFISTGLSSYFMTRENYEYYYQYMGNPATRNAAYKSSDTHILSIAHLSAGFERRISRNLSLQVEPYAKIPLAGVGLGQIKLSSFGLNFGLQFRQPSKR
ncbi:outer membrane beta-barrel protein [Sediminibacterium soli]|uniref:outer membrane beta-barrel protein n=1 Tax=Sediminibacterium soli TaxID=2698829 RepID=UPI00137B0871|nr:outer membrane beta-barrel protein [Sediminibacterium soli]NCI46924.1 PorT family protein [Sediminibacterium soli]